MDNSSTNDNLKMLTLEAWAKILYDKGMLDLQQYNKMVEQFRRSAV